MKVFSLIILLLCTTQSKYLIAHSSIPDSTFKRSEKSLSVTRTIRDSFNVFFDASAIGFGIMGPAGVVGSIGSLGMKTIYDSMLSRSLQDQERTSLLRYSIHQEIQTIRGDWKTKGEDFYRDPIQTKLAITEKLLNSVTDPRFKEDAQLQMPYTIALLGEQRESISKLADEYKTLAKNMQTKKGTEEVFQQFSNRLNSIGQSFGSASKQIGNLEKSLQNGQSALAHVAGEVKTEFANIHTKLGLLSQNEAQLKEVGNYLFQEALLVNTQAFESSKHIMKLESELMELGKQQDQVGVFKKSHELKQAIQVEHEKRLAFDNKLDTLGAGMDLVALGASFLGNKKLAYQISTVGHAAVTIGKGIGALMGVGAAAAVSGPLAPIVAIGGAILSIISLFDTSPSIDEVILEQIQKLQEQVQVVRKEMHERFDHVERMIFEQHKHINVRFDRLEDMLGKLHAQMHERFDRVETLLNRFYQDVFEEFSKVQCTTTAILELSRKVKSQLDRIESKMDQQMQALYSQQYGISRDLALNFHARGVQTLMSVEKQKEYFSLFENFAAKYASHFMYTGINSGTHQDVLDCIRQKQVEFCLGLMSSILTTYGVPAYPGLPNPIIWAEGVDTLLEFVYRTPELDIQDNHQDGIDSVEVPGQRFLAFIKELKTNSGAVLKLFQKYREAVATVKDALFDLWAEKNINTTVLSVKPPSLKDAGNRLVETVMDLLRHRDREAVGHASHHFLALLRKAEQIYNRESPSFDPVTEYLEHHMSANERKDLHDRFASAAASEGSELHRALGELDLCHAMTTAYLELGFHTEFHTSSEFKSCIQDLVTGETMRTRLKTYNGSAREGHFYYVLKRELMPAVDRLESQVFEKVASAQIQKEKNTLSAGYPLVDDVLVDLSIFRSVFFSQEPEVSKTDEL